MFRLLFAGLVCVDWDQKIYLKSNWIACLGQKFWDQSSQLKFPEKTKLNDNICLPEQKNPKGTYKKKYRTIKIKFRQDRSQPVGPRPFIFDSLNWTSWNVLISFLFELANKTETFMKCVLHAFYGQISTCNQTPFVRKYFYHFYFYHLHTLLC